MHVVVLKVPVALLVKVTAPVGVTAPAPEESDTVTVQVVADPVFTDAGAHVTEVVVDLIVEASVKVPLLPV